HEHDAARDRQAVRRACKARGEAGVRSYGAFLEARDTADLVAAGATDALVDRVVVGVPGEDSAATERTRGKLRRRPVHCGVGLTVIDAVEVAVCPTAQKI